MEKDFLIGCVDGEDYLIQNNVEQIVAFIMKNSHTDTVITTPLDTLVLTTVCGGFIMKCPDQKFLAEELLPLLAPVQMGEKEAPEFTPLNEEDFEI